MSILFVCGPMSAPFSATTPMAAETVSRSPTAAARALSVSARARAVGIEQAMLARSGARADSSRDWRPWASLSGGARRADSFPAAVGAVRQVGGAGATVPRHDTGVGDDRHRRQRRDRRDHATNAPNPRGDRPLGGRVLFTASGRQPCSWSHLPGHTCGAPTEVPSAQYTCAFGSFVSCGHVLVHERVGRRSTKKDLATDVNRSQKGNAHRPHRAPAGASHVGSGAGGRFVGNPGARGHDTFGLGDYCDRRPHPDRLVVHERRVAAEARRPARPPSRGGLANGPGSSRPMRRGRGTPVSR
jgi:hypothetical protein